MVEEPSHKGGAKSLLSRRTDRTQKEIQVEDDLIKATNKMSGNHSTILQTYVSMMSYGQRSIAAEESHSDTDDDGEGHRTSLNEEQADFHSESVRSKHRNIKKLGPCSTYMTVFKGFMSVGVLYLPLNFFKGGLTFSLVCFLIAGFFTLNCVHLLLQVRAKTEYRSFAEMGINIIGPWSLHLIHFILTACQLSFCLAFVYLIIEVFHEFLLEVADFDIARAYVGVGVATILTLLCFVRKILK